MDSTSNRSRTRDRRKGKEKQPDSENSEETAKKDEPTLPPTYDCGGAIHLKFSIKREAINVVYQHNPIHARPLDDQR